MAKRQYIRISSKSGNDRIEEAIPKFRRKGMAKDQATATAIRLESIGRLDDSARPIRKGSSLSKRLAAAALTGAIRRKTTASTPPARAAESVDELVRLTKRTTKKLPKRARSPKR